jgi:hypothetical protein
MLDERVKPRSYSRKTVTVVLRVLEDGGQFFGCFRKAGLRRGIIGTRMSSTAIPLSGPVKVSGPGTNGGIIPGPANLQLNPRPEKRLTTTIVVPDPLVQQR